MSDDPITEAKKRLFEENREDFLRLGVKSHEQIEVKLHLSGDIEDAKEGVISRIFDWVNGLRIVKRFKSSMVGGGILTLISISLLVRDVSDDLSFGRDTIVYVFNSIESISEYFETDEQGNAIVVDQKSNQPGFVILSDLNELRERSSSSSSDEAVFLATVVPVSGAPETILRDITRLS